MSVSSIATPQTPRPKPRFNFSDQSSVIDTYESYAKEGFLHLMTQNTKLKSPDNRKKRRKTKAEIMYIMVLPVFQQTDPPSR